MNALAPIGKRLDWDRSAVSRAAAPAAAPDLRSLICLEAAVRHGSFARAAQELGVSASAISQQLHKLEEERGGRLLIRHGRGVAATPLGASLAARTAAVLRLLRAPLDTQVESLAPEGGISIVLPAEQSGFLAGPLALRVRRDWPAVTLALRESADGGGESLLLRGQADIAILPNQPEVEGLHIQRVAIEHLGLVAAPGSALGRSGGPLRFRDLARVPLILPGEGHWIRRLLAKTAFQRGVGLDVAVQSDGPAATRDMVRAGLGCTVFPSAAVREETARGSLVFRLLEQPALQVVHAVVIGDLAAPAVRAVAGAIAHALRTLAASGAWPGAVAAASSVSGDEASPAPAAWRVDRSETHAAYVESIDGD